MNCVAITLPERLSYVKELEEKIKMPITIFNALRGHRTMFENFGHILPNESITNGMIGCLLSHLTLLKEAKTNILIFEDDCEFVSDINEYFKCVPEFDILCLGTNENVDYSLVDSNKYVKVTRFWGTHALLIKYSAIEAILNTYEKYKEKHIFLPADWLYSKAIQEFNLRAYAPFHTKQYFKQKSGLVSQINGKIRH